MTTDQYTTVHKIVDELQQLQFSLPGKHKMAEYHEAESKKYRDEINEISIQINDYIKILEAK